MVCYETLTLRDGTTHRIQFLNSIRVKEKMLHRMAANSSDKFAALGA